MVKHPPHHSEFTTDRHSQLKKCVFMMRSEIGTAVSFLKSLIKLKKQVEVEKIHLFGERLTVALQDKFEGHWFPDNPCKGQAYRCIRVNAVYQHDPELLRACRESGVHYSDMGLPWELTLWVDPGEVHGRYGEQNFSFSVAMFSDDKGEIMDYHSGSSEKTHSSPFIVANRKCSKQTLNPAAPAWYPQKKS